MTHQPGTSAFWIYGGRDADGLLLADLHAFDMEAEQWVTPQSLNEPPAPREHHAACFVAERCVPHLAAALRLLEVET
jgi:hypothetical protein